MAHPEPPASRPGGAWFWVGNAANLVGLITGFITGWMLVSIILVALGLGVLGYWVYARGSTAIGIAVLAAVLLSGFGTVVGMTWWNGRSTAGITGQAPAAGAVTGSSAPAVSSSSSSSSSSVASEVPTTTPPVTVTSDPGRPALLVDTDVSIPRHTAVDVDRPDQPVVKTDVGATGAFDLFHDAGAVMSDALRTPDGTFGYPAFAAINVATSYDTCADYTGPSPSYNSNVPSAYVITDTTFCFVTSDGHVAWAKVQAVQADKTAVLSVRVWDRLAAG